MSFKDEGLRKPPGQGFHESFLDIASLDVSTFLDALISREQQLADITLSRLKNTDPKKLAHPEKLPLPTFDLAQAFAALETTCLEYEHPLLLKEALQFPSLFRFLRSAELYHKVPRGGNTLMIGAGIAVHEFLAQYIKPPEKSTIEECLKARTPDFIKQRVEKKSGDFYEKPVQLLSGKAYAVEPDPKQLKHIDGLISQFGIPQDRITILPHTISDALQSGTIQGMLNTVLWHRADPKIVALPEQSTFDQKQLTSLLASLKGHLVRGGRMIITVGGGNALIDPKEKDERIRFIKKAQASLQQMGFDQVTKIPLIFDNIYGALFGDETVGMMGGFITRKN